MHNSKVTNFYTVTKDFYWNLMLFFWTFFSSNNPKKFQDLDKIIKQNKNVPRKVSWAPKRHIKLTYEGSCNTEDEDLSCNCLSFILVV